MSIQLDAKNDWSFYLKALSHLKQNELEALNDLGKAISIALQRSRKKYKNHHNTFKLALYYLVKKDTGQAIELYQSAISKCMNIRSIKLASNRLEYYLKIFPQNQDELTLLQLIKNRLNELVSKLKRIMNLTQ